MAEQEGVLMARAEVLAAVGGAIAIVNQGELGVDAELLDYAPNLRIVANIARGFDNLDLAAMTARGVWATNVPDAFAAPTAEVALALMLMVMRRLGEADRYVQAGEWTRFDPGRWDGATLVGKTLGLIGFGKIGQAVANRARAFGMEIIYTQRHRVDDSDATWLPLDELLARADIVSLHMPATPETFHMINAETLGRMKPGAVLINTARGSVVDECALVEALRRGHLGGVGLDVAEHEPRVHPALLAQRNVVITPHLGGGTVESRREARSWAIANVAAVLAGNAPLSPLNDLG
jgi:glyoxylate reductase